MSETREQFRERIGKIAANWHGVSWDYLDDAERHDYEDAAEAVYAVSLRDLCNNFARFNRGELFEGKDIVGDLRIIAADLGIDLGGGDQ